MPFSLHAPPYTKPCCGYVIKWPFLAGGANLLEDHALIQMLAGQTPSTNHLMTIENHLMTID